MVGAAEMGHKATSLPALLSGFSQTGQVLSRAIVLVWLVA